MTNLQALALGSRCVTAVCPATFFSSRPVPGAKLISFVPLALIKVMISSSVKIFPADFLGALPQP